MFPWVALAHAATPESAIDAVLDDLHRAAAEADEVTYFSRFTDDAVFIGTDPDERWTLPEFRTWAAPRFQGESAWTYTPRTRHVTVGPKRRTAWFDETLEHATYGVVRGSGALVREGRDWKVAHYVLSFAVPNAVAMHTVQATKGELFLPTPFTAAQIRDAMPVGAIFEHERRGIGDDAVLRSQWEVRAADAEGCTIAYRSGDGGPVERTHRWTELRDHAKFAAPLTSVADERIETPVGTLDCRRYTVTAEREPTRIFWFCPDMPGAPVRVHTVEGDEVVERFDLVHRSP